MKQITSKNIGNLNKILNKNSPSSLCEGLESLVALMRNHEVATPIDVELYFRDFNKIVLKMQRLDAAALDRDLIEKHRVDLQNIKPHFTDQNSSDYRKNSEFAPLIEWGCEFCVYAQKVKNIQQMQDDITDLNAAQNQLASQIQMSKAVDQMQA